MAEAYYLRGKLFDAKTDSLKKKVYLSRTLELAKIQKTPTSLHLLCQALTALADQARFEGFEEEAATYSRECIQLTYAHIVTEAPSLSFAEQMSLVDSAEVAKTCYFSHCTSKRDMMLEYGHMLPLKGPTQRIAA